MEAFGLQQSWRPFIYKGVFPYKRIVTSNQSSTTSYCAFGQVPFLAGMGAMGEIKTMFSAEVLTYSSNVFSFHTVFET